MLTTPTSKLASGTQSDLSSFEGALYKGNKVLRPVFNRGFRRIKTTQELKSTLRCGQYTYPGCYPLFFITRDGAALSFESVREELRSVLASIKSKSNDGWRVVACEVNYEDGSLYCEHSGKRIEAAYVEEDEAAD